MSLFIRIGFCLVFYCPHYFSFGQDFKILVGRYAEEKPISFFEEKGLTGLIHKQDQNFQHCYFLSPFQTYLEAETYRRKLLKAGFPNSEVYDEAEARVLCGGNCPDFVKTTFVNETKSRQYVRSIFFSDRSNLLLPEANHELQSLVKFLRANRTARVKIVGHTEPIGDRTQKIELAKRRCRMVRDYLIGSGISRDRLEFRYQVDDSNTNKKFKDQEIRFMRRIVFSVCDASGELVKI
jgi:outer membrane protein OmpA-like peptidoglycan-associated protein